MKPTVLIYNRYFNTFGGGERSTLSVALFFESIGFEVILASLSKFNHNYLLDFFGFKAETTWNNLIVGSEKDVEHYVKTKGISVFVNHTYGSFIANRAPIGIYLVMFPHRAGYRELVKIKTYTHIVSISHFSDKYVERYWKVKDKRHVLIPPILSGEQPDYKKKEKLILNIGRFSTSGHVKNQHLAISTFKDLKLPEWKLVVAGHVGKSRENINYFNKCKKLAEGFNIEVLADISHDRLIELYKKASLLWQLTGCQLVRDEHPEFCEHLGLVAMDCFSYGVFPMVLHRSGVSSLINQHENGFIFDTLEELKKETLDYAKNWESQTSAIQFQLSFETSKLYSFENYKQNFNKVIYG